MAHGAWSADHMLVIYMVETILLANKERESLVTCAGRSVYMVRRKTVLFLYMNGLVTTRSM